MLGLEDGQASYAKQHILRCDMKILKSKTILFSLLLAVLGAVEASLNLFADVLTPTTYGIVTMVVGVIVAGLRIITTQPLSDK